MAGAVTYYIHRAFKLSFTQQDMALLFGVEKELLICPGHGSTFNGFMKEKGWDPQVDSVGPPGQIVTDETLAKRAANRYAVRFAIVMVLRKAGIPATMEQTDYQSWSISTVSSR